MYGNIDDDELASLLNKYGSSSGEDSSKSSSSSGYSSNTGYSSDTGNKSNTGYSSNTGFRSNAGYSANTDYSSNTGYNSTSDYDINKYVKNKTVPKTENKKETSSKSGLSVKRDGKGSGSNNGNASSFGSDSGVGSGSGGYSVSKSVSSDSSFNSYGSELDDLVEDYKYGKYVKKKDEIDRSADEIRKKIKKSPAPRRRNDKSNLITNILLVVFILIFLGSGAYLGIYYMNMNKSESHFEELKALIDTDTNTVAPKGADVKESKSDYITYVDVNGVQVQSKYVNLYKRNNDFIGWLTVPDTRIDYPVMCTPEDEQHYLHIDFDNQNSYAGTLFLGKGSDIRKPSDNIVIYGHNMKAGTMFHDLLLYEDEKFYQEHKYIYFHTIENNGNYEVIAAFRTKISEDDPNFLKYYEFIDASNKEEFDDFVKRVKEMTPYDIPLSAEYGDKLITLSTCAYHTNEGRYVVVAKKLE